MIEDLAGLGKIAEVISGAIGKAIGTVIEPWQTRRVGYAKADVEAYSLEKLAEARAKAEMITSTGSESRSVSEPASQELRARAGQRLIVQETTRQRNIEAIYHEAAAHAQKAEQNGADSRPIEDDWINDFLEYAQNVSNEQLRQIWSKILANQAIDGAPSASKATLDAIRLIEPEQAVMFERAVRLYLAMGQIIDVDPIEGFDIGYYSQMLEASSLEDLGLLKKMRDIEPHLEIHGGILTFWRDVHPGERTGEYVYWTDPRVRQPFLQNVNAVATGAERDFSRLREAIRVERQILTSRGFELAAVVVPGFYDLIQSSVAVDEDFDSGDTSSVSEHLSPGASETPDPASVSNGHLPKSDFDRPDVREIILRQWAARFSAQGAAVILAQPIASDFTPPSQKPKGQNDADIGRRIDFHPARVFNPDKDCWEALDL